MKTLTKKQKQVIDFIRAFIEEFEFAPSYEEIAQRMGLSSVSTVHTHVENLTAKGYLTKKWNSNRSIDLPENSGGPGGSYDLPLKGRIAAGAPIEAIEDVETIGIPPDMIGRNETYVLEVKGDSMIGDHVVDGDYIIVEKRQTAKDGDMVVALVKDGSATLKRFRRERSKIRLEPANPAFKPIVLNEADVRIQGVVIGILRKYRKAGN